MKNNIKTKLIRAILVIVVAVLLAIVLISHNAFARQAGEDENPVNYDVTKHLQYPSIRDLLPANQVLSDGRFYIKHADLINFPSIMCSAKTIHLPREENTVVRSGGKSTKRTDGGKLTGYLTMNDRNHATVFKNQGHWVTTGQPYSRTTSETFALFHIVDVYKATPAEAWVLSEMDMNDPNKTSITFEYTDQEYIDNQELLVDENKYQGVNNTTLWAVEWDPESGDPTRYVAERNGRHYYVTPDDYAPYTYVQHAWWKEKKVGYLNADYSTVKDTDLAAEAEAFEAYIKKIAVYQNEENYRMSDVDADGDDERFAIGKWQWNEDNTIKVDYRNYEGLDGQRRTLGVDSTQYNVRFNAETNKYIVGPFTLNYLRTGTKQGTREKVSFSGISQTTLIGTDANGNKLLDENGESILKLGENYKFVYDHNHDDYIPTIVVRNGSSSSTEKLDTEEDYPYPYDNEEFYIEVDYIDNMAFLSELDFDFQYMNAGATFEYLEGNYLVITWTPDCDYQPASSGGASSGALPGSDVTYGGITRTNSLLSLAGIDLSDRFAYETGSIGENGSSKIELKGYRRLRFKDATS